MLGCPTVEGQQQFGCRSHRYLPGTAFPRVVFSPSAIFIARPMSCFGHLCHLGLCVVLVSGGPTGLGGASVGLESQGGLCFVCALLCPGLPLSGAGTGMGGGGAGLLFSLLHGSLIPSPGGDPVSPNRLLFTLLLLHCWDSRWPQVKGEAGTNPHLPLPIPRAGCGVLVVIPARSCFVAGFDFAGSGVACQMLPAESGPLFISRGVVLSLSPSTMEAGARISTARCGSLWEAAGVGATPRGQGARVKVWAPQLRQRSDEVCRVWSWTVKDCRFSHGFIVWCLLLLSAPSGFFCLGAGSERQERGDAGVGGTQRACRVFEGHIHTRVYKTPTQMPHPQEVFFGGCSCGFRRQMVLIT